MNFDISEKDIFTALSKTRYQRGPGSYNNETKAIRTIFLETPIPKTEFLTITEKIEKKASEPPPPPPEKEKIKQQTQSKEDIYAILRQAQGITSNEGPRRGVGTVQQEFNHGYPSTMPYPMPMPRPGMPGMPGMPLQPGMRPQPFIPGATHNPNATMPGMGQMAAGNGHSINGSPFATNIGGNTFNPQPRNMRDIDDDDEEEDNDN